MSLTTSIQLTKTSTYKLNNGQHIPVAGFGVYQLPAKDTINLVYSALEQGYRHIDSAYAYGNEAESAEGIAKFLKDHPLVQRLDIWFTTKIASSHVSGYEETKALVKTIADDVKKHIDYVDLILIHDPKTDKTKRLAIWKALQEYVIDPNNSTLQIKSIGVSNYGIRHLEELLNWDGLLVKPVVNQLELHPWLPHVKLREYCVSKNILNEAYTPLTQGEKFDDPELVALSKKYGLPPAEILLKWSYLQGFIVLAKTGTTSRIKQNLDALPDGKEDPLDETSHLGKVDLDPEIVETLDKPDSHYVICWGHEDPTEWTG